MPISHDSTAKNQRDPCKTITQKSSVLMSIETAPNDNNAINTRSSASSTKTFNATSRPGFESYVENLPFSRVRSSCLLGIDAVPVEVEAKVLPSRGNILKLVGLPDGVLKEAKERVKCAILNSGFLMPEGEIIVSLSPAELPKTGSGFDLAIALAILAADGQLVRQTLCDKIFLGELALDGRLRKTKGALAAGIHLRKTPELTLIVPRLNSGELSILRNDRIHLANNLAETVHAINGRCILSTPPVLALRRNYKKDGELTYKDVRGQPVAIRACEIAAAGGHNLLFIGPPGSGKSMLAERIPSILPPLMEEEQLEVLSVYDAHYLQLSREQDRRPYRAPHHTCSTPGLIGGGAGPTPGEISLAHKGVLFLDELPEFKREGLESLRQPLEEKKLTLSRATKRVTFPADFMLIAAMNPCPCGKKGSLGGGCRCNEGQIKRYLSKISGPLLERIDIQLWVYPPKIEELRGVASKDRTEEVREHVKKARDLQIMRAGKLNSFLTTSELQTHQQMSTEAQDLLERVAKKHALSARSYMRAIKVSRTIADLAGVEEISSQEMAEALSYRLKIEEILRPTH